VGNERVGGDGGFYPGYLQETRSPPLREIRKNRVGEVRKEVPTSKKNPKKK